jgi:conjugative transposon TraM protein
MKMESKNVRKGKALLILPLVIIPFLTLAFWALGGGKGTSQQQSPSSSGLNMQLPDAHLKNDKDENKMSFYEKAERDSVKFRQAVKNDPLFQITTPGDTNLSKYGSITFAAKPGTHKDPNEEKVYQKLAELNRQLSNKVEVQPKVSGQTEMASVKIEGVDQLKNLLQDIGKDPGKDPEMEQLNGMMEKILDIQHPERVNETQRKNSLEHKADVFPVTSVNYDDNISLFGNDAITDHHADTLIKKSDLHNRFYSLENQRDAEDNDQKAVRAAVYQTQTILTGETVKLRLLNDVYIAGILLPKDNFVFGTAALNGERLNITVNSIRYRNSLLPVALSVYDMDGMDGIYVPGAILRDVTKQSTDNTLQNIGLSSLDPSIGMQAAGAGIQTAKNLISKKVKLVRVTLKAGYEVLLKDSDHKQ